MDVTTRRELARRALAGYVSGPEASTRATARALAKIDDAQAVVLVEGVSDQIAVETAAVARGRELVAEGVVIAPIGGRTRSGASWRRCPRWAPGCDWLLCATCARRRIFRRGLVATEVVSPRSPADPQYVGLFVCVDDLEDELIRAVGAAGVEALFDAQGDLSSFRSLQSQPAWRGREPEAQMRRFLGSGSGRKLRYARLLVEEAAGRGTSCLVRSTPCSPRSDRPGQRCCTRKGV